MTLRDDFIGELDRAPARFLIELCWQLHISTRGYYASASLDPEMTRQALEGMNELALIVAEQLRSLDRKPWAYDNETFIQLLGEKAGIYKVGGDLRGSIERALERLSG